jgi:hypothetical protein
MKNSISNKQFHKIKALEVQGGFLDGLQMKFDNNLNCLIVIGGTKNGKT